MVHTHNGILLSHKKEWNNTISSNMDGPGNYTKRNVRERQISWYCLYVEYFLKGYRSTYLQKKKQTHRLRNQTYGYHRGKVSGKDKLGVWYWHIYTTTFKTDNNKDLLYNTGSSAQYSAMT